MSWSTSQLAGIAGTTVKAIRYYHQIGVLPEPKRASNGYKKYQVEHLVTLLRILRLKDLGLSVQDIDRVGGGADGNDDDVWNVLEALDAEIESRIQRWTAVRAELAALLRGPHDSAPIIDLPAGMLGLTDDVTDADRAILLVYSQLFNEQTMQDIAETLRDRTRSPQEIEFDVLPPDADQQTRQHLALRLAATFSEASGMGEVERLPVPLLSQDPKTAEDVLGATLAQVYNQAQLDVLRQVSVLVTAGETPRQEKN